VCIWAWYCALIIYLFLGGPCDAMQDGSRSQDQQDSGECVGEAPNNQTGITPMTLSGGPIIN
jgi:hypothetical protein